MPKTSPRTLTVTLGAQQRVVDERLASGTYASASEIVRAGLRALEREEAVLNETLRRMVQEALDDPQPPVPMEEVFERLERKHLERHGKME
ncbi:type II toxin-antitoxin system ParD family antitoxin [Aureimonas psammosilenae]|uniref:type II toxin-antitoxin system ParD family antitoxin n=1 Tax=Aureimonas psammosilenae TaxID=2495496 RepID=UPI0012607902|nr:type II toxin-antitoxin system ParD family antitoxin [Aureimonas psammosilenae]